MKNLEEIGNGAFALSGDLNILVNSYLELILNALPDGLFGTDSDGDGYDDETGNPMPTQEEKLTYLLMMVGELLYVILSALGLTGSSVSETGETYSLKKFNVDDVKNEDSVVSALSLKRAGGPVITIPGTTKRVGKLAFMATPIGEVVIEEGVEEIDDFAFGHESSLKRKEMKLLVCVQKRLSMRKNYVLRQKPLKRTRLMSLKRHVCRL